MRTTACIFAILLAFQACKSPSSEEPFDALYSLAASTAATGWGANPDSSATPLNLIEVSGGVPARDFPGCFWALQDGGNPAALHLVDFASGATRVTLLLEDLENNDWEDLGSDGTHLFLADIGDNKAERSSIRVHQILEPSSAELMFSTGDTLLWTPQDLHTRDLVYPDGPRDAESLVVVPFSDDVLIITKRDSPARIYSFPKNTAQTGEESLVFRGTLPHFYSTGAGAWTAPNQDSAWIGLRTYTGASVWTIKPGKSWMQALQKAPRSLPYPRREPQGETIFFWPNGDWTPLSEKAQGVVTPPYRFKRN